MRIDHYGYVVEDIDKAIECFTNLGYSIVVEKFHQEKRKQWVAFVGDENQANQIELLEPTDESAPAYGVLKKRGMGLYHICYLTEDIEAKVEELRENGFLCISPIDVNQMGEKMIFMYHKNVGIIELFEREM